MTFLTYCLFILFRLLLLGISPSDSLSLNKLIKAQLQFHLLYDIFNHSRPLVIFLFQGFFHLLPFSLYLAIIYFLKIFWKKLITFSVRWGQLKGEVTLFRWFKPCYIIVVLLYNLHYPSIDLCTVCALNKYLFDSKKMSLPIVSFSSL